MKMKIFTALGALTFFFFTLESYEKRGAAPEPSVPSSVQAPRAETLASAETTQAEVRTGPAPSPESPPAPAAPVVSMPAAQVVSKPAAQVGSCEGDFQAKPISEKSAVDGWEGFPKVLDYFACRAYAEGKTAGVKLEDFQSSHFEPRLQKIFSQQSGLDQVKLLEIRKASREGQRDQALWLCQTFFGQADYASFVAPGSLLPLCRNMVHDYAQDSSSLCSHPEYFSLHGADLRSFRKDCEALFGGGPADCSKFSGEAASRCRLRAQFVAAVQRGKPEDCPAPGSYSSLCRAMLSQDPAAVCAAAGEAAAYGYCSWRRSQQFNEETNRRLKELKDKKKKGAAGKPDKTPPSEPAPEPNKKTGPF